jgi:hypothetical protein
VAIIPEVDSTPHSDFPPAHEGTNRLAPSLPPEQLLACAVLRQARADLLAWDLAVRTQARQFFSAADPMLSFWCDVLDIADMAAVVRAADAVWAGASLAAQLNLFGDDSV